VSDCPACGGKRVCATTASYDMLATTSVRSVQACCGQLGSPAASLHRRGSLPLYGGRGEPGTEASCAPNAGPLRKGVEQSGGGGIACSGRADDESPRSRGYPLRRRALRGRDGAESGFGRRYLLDLDPAPRRGCAAGIARLAIDEPVVPVGRNGANRAGTSALPAGLHRRCFRASLTRGASLLEPARLPIQLLEVAAELLARLLPLPG
jgi:hypothetical protein